MVKIETTDNINGKDVEILCIFAENAKWCNYSEMSLEVLYKAKHSL